MPRLTCSKCGGQINVTMRDRHPHGTQPFVRCLGCGAGGWERDLSETSTVRYMESAPTGPVRGTWAGEWPMVVGEVVA